MIPIPDDKLYQRQIGATLYFFKDKEETIIHRDYDQPAIIANNLFGWLKNHEYHREVGAAFICAGREIFYLNGKSLNQKEWAQLTGHLVCQKCEKFCRQNCFQTKEFFSNI